MNDRMPRGRRFAFGLGILAVVFANLLMSFPWTSTLTSAGLRGIKLERTLDWLGWGLFAGFVISALGSAWMFLRSKARPD